MSYIFLNNGIVVWKHGHVMQKGATWRSSKNCSVGPPGSRTTVSHHFLKSGFLVPDSLGNRIWTKSWCGVQSPEWGERRSGAEKSEGKKEGVYYRGDHSFTTVTARCSAMRDIWREAYTRHDIRTASEGRKEMNLSTSPLSAPDSFWVKSVPLGLTPLHLQVALVATPSDLEEARARLGAVVPLREMVSREGPLSADLLPL